MIVDWKNSPDVERIPGKVSGAWLVKGTRIRADDVIANATDCTPEEIVAEIYPSLPLNTVARLVSYARKKANAANPA
jgi:uncharacterized protein (DUF433 family)